MHIELAHITPRRLRLKSAPAQLMLDDYLKRASRHLPIQSTPYDTEPSLLAALTRSPTHLILLDSRGDLSTSEALAARLGRLRDAAIPRLTFAIGPPDGWSPAALPRAHHRLSLSPMTLPHELALLVLAEQVYRALTILAGHPYHAGHRA